MDKTVKIRAYSEDAKSDTLRDNLSEDQNKSLVIAKKDLELEEEKSKSLENLKLIVRLRESLKQEQAKTVEIVKITTELEAKVNELAAAESLELSKKDLQLEEEKNKSHELLKVVEQLRESLKQEQARTAELEVKASEWDALESIELAKKNAQLEEEKEKSLEHLKLIEQLRESLKQEQAMKAEVVENAVELELKIKQMTEVLCKISSIAAAGKVGQQ